MDRTRCLTTFDDANNPIAQSVAYTWYPSRGPLSFFNVAYRFNSIVPDAIENKLLQSNEYQDQDTKDSFIYHYLFGKYPQLISRGWRHMKVTIRTNKNGVVSHSIEEDKSHLPMYVNSKEFPEKTQRVLIKDIHKLRQPGYQTWVIEWKRVNFILREHKEANQDRTMAAELQAFVCNGLSSPHVAKFKGYSSTTTGGVRGIVREFCERGYLSEWLRNHDRSWEEKLKWVAQICHGLISIHASGITHCDFRLEDVLLDKNRNAKILDIAQGHGWLDGYYPTKRFPNESLYHPKWDVFSFGVTLWQVVNDGKNYIKAGKLEFGIYEDVENLPEAGRKLVDIMTQCLQEDPEKRPTLEEAFQRLGGFGSCGCKVKKQK